MRARQRAFTLIELMVVIGIVALLLAILLPSLSAARTQAKVSATKATLAVLDTGIESFRMDSSLQGAYPPSMSPGANTATLSVPAGAALDPRPSSPSSAGPIAVQGANLLVWALAGADLQGTPGFPNGWPAQTAGGRAPTGSSYGLYTINSDTNQPFVARRGPFVEVGKVNLTKTVTTGTSGLPTYQVPAAVGRPQASPRSENLDWPCFLDTFDRPILYYRANLGKRYPASTCGGDYNSANYSGTYELYDNAYFTGTGGGGLDVGTGPQHPLGNFGNVDQNTGMPSVPKTFSWFVWDRNVTVKGTAQRPDSYLLISAGPDGKYGTGDDVTNFKPNY